jgi:hypothetical protein
MAPWTIFIVCPDILGNIQLSLILEQVNNVGVPENRLSPWESAAYKFEERKIFHKDILTIGQDKWGY